MSRHLVPMLRHPVVPAPAVAVLYGVMCWLASQAADSVDLCYEGDDRLAVAGAGLLVGALVLTAARARRRGWRPVVSATVTAVTGLCLVPVMFACWLAAAFSACFTF
jgi:hypothetical protein